MTGARAGLRLTPIPNASRQSFYGHSRRPDPSSWVGLRGRGTVQPELRDRSPSRLAEVLTLPRPRRTQPHGEPEARLTGCGQRQNGGYQGIVPGNSAASRVIARVSADENPMPPTGDRLTAGEIDTLRRWIDAGAKYERHWAFNPPVRPEPPTVSDPGWIRNPIDSFVLARLDREALQPSPEADRHTLIRRLSLALTGLPPTPAEVDAFVNDDSAEAYSALVDRLLNSTAYGERWARVWLDLARYADSMGYEKDSIRTIWPYRDWVIQALNENIPFDRFTVLQLAGDLLPDPSTDQVVATGFHRNTMTNTEGGTDDEEFRDAAVKDRVATTGQVWMGLTWGCAQCHSHKYDPLSQQEFYSLYAFLNQTADADRNDDAPKLELTKGVSTLVLRELPPKERRDTFLHNRGNFMNPGEQVAPGVPEALHPFPSGAPLDRLGLARWLTSKENPLTARVAVNRLWARLFGAGIVRTEEDFGTQGTPPTHPELLDWLATEFMRVNWDVKDILKTIVTSATYRQSSDITPELLEVDPENSLLARGARFRMSAEMVRDQALFASGLLSRKIGGEPVMPWQPEGIWQVVYSSKQWKTSPGADRYRRALYTLWRRTSPYPSMTTFDAPSGETCTVRRIRTNTPLQALVTLNDPTLMEAAQHLAARTGTGPGTTPNGVWSASSGLCCRARHHLRKPGDCSRFRPRRHPSCARNRRTPASLRTTTVSCTRQTDARRWLATREGIPRTGGTRPKTLETAGRCPDLTTPAGIAGREPSELRSVPTSATLPTRTEPACKPIGIPPTCGPGLNSTSPIRACKKCVWKAASRARSRLLSMASQPPRRSTDREHSPRSN